MSFRAGRKTGMGISWYNPDHCIAKANIVPGDCHGLSGLAMTSFSDSSRDYDGELNPYIYSFGCFVTRKGKEKYFKRCKL